MTELDLAQLLRSTCPSSRGARGRAGRSAGVRSPGPAGVARAALAMPVVTSGVATEQEPQIVVSDLITRSMTSRRPVARHRAQWATKQRTSVVMAAIRVVDNGASLAAVRYAEEAFAARPIPDPHRDGGCRLIDRAGASAQPGCPR